MPSFRVSFHPSRDSHYQSLLEKAQSGCQESLGQLLQEVGPSVESALKIGSKWRPLLDSTDIMQITYLEAITRFPAFEGNMAGFTDWLKKIAENNVFDGIAELSAIKRPQPEDRIVAAGEEKAVTILYTTILGPDKTPSTETHMKDVGNRLREAIDELPKSYARVILSYFYEQKSPTEIAEAMKRSIGAIYIIRRRALEKLESILGSQSTY